MKVGEVGLCLNNPLNAKWRLHIERQDHIGGSEHIRG